MTFSGVLIVYWLKEKLGTIMYYPRENIAMFGTGRNCLSSGKVGQNGPLSKTQLGQQELLIHKKSSSNIHLQYNILAPLLSQTIIITDKRTELYSSSIT